MDIFTATLWPRKSFGYGHASVESATVPLAMREGEEDLRFCNGSIDRLIHRMVKRRERAGRTGRTPPFLLISRFVWQTRCTTVGPLATDPRSRAGFGRRRKQNMSSLGMRWHSY